MPRHPSGGRPDQGLLRALIGATAIAQLPSIFPAIQTAQQWPFPETPPPAKAAAWASGLQGGAGATLRRCGDSGVGVVFFRFRYGNPVNRVQFIRGWGFSTASI